MATGWTAYAYYPSVGGAAVMIMLFLIGVIIFTYQLIRTRAWLTIAALIGGMFETVGYIGRAMSGNQSPNWTLGPYIIQSTLLLIAPALFAATIYMILGRIIALVHGEHHSIIRLKWLTKIFVVGDCLSFLMQSSGAGIMVQSKSATDNTGENVIIGGLLVQIIFFCFFLVVAIIFQRRIYRHPTVRSESPMIPWRKHFFSLYASSFLILIRSIVRFIEYIQGQEGYVITHEAFIYVFDAVPMFLVLCILIRFHPSEINGLLGKSRVAAVGYGLRFVDVSPAM
ncbi:RTA1 domain protein [Aspergillus eucalypticola CBS 122712]|uniref:RTA1 domain protein n=1 Tax=Aspergillus eucalypticola (strain CBS 122712 / IBT 29274) TaxID=1448314 RepID=A0A317VKM8_ASPEC|nr:RTA1 domain protein [Aspergillus eucalypticola CBS 122712]PWY74924.1 RTA1 domain protein [Aspergillus eucalypticola CBS 122712]